MTSFLFIAAIVILLVLRQRLMVVLGVASALLYILFGNGRLDYVVLDMWAAVDREVLLSIPLFILAGNIMAKGSIARRLIEVVSIGTRPIPGGLGIATVLSCAVFSAISGSSTVTLIAVGSIMYPALVNSGYSKSFSLGLVAAGGTLGIIIPPSIPLILYGVITETSIADLFIAGLGPATLLILILTAYTVIMNRHVATASIDWPQFWTACRAAVFAAMMPVIILGGIYSGYFTPTESAAVAVLYAVLVELFIHRELTLTSLKDISIDTATTLGALLPVLMFALSINTFLAFEQVPGDIVETMNGLVGSKIGFLAMTLVLLLVFGCFMDIGSAILILSPLLTPIAQSYGINPVHFGVIMIVNLEVGYLTPPLGLNIIVAMGAFKEPFWVIAKAALPFIGLLILGLLITTFWPSLSLFLL